MLVINEIQIKISVIILYMPFYKDKNNLFERCHSTNVLRYMKISNFIREIDNSNLPG